MDFSKATQATVKAAETRFTRKMKRKTKMDVIKIQHNTSRELRWNQQNESKEDS